MHYVVIDNQQQVHIINQEELDFALARGAKELYKGSKKECDKYYDDFVQESGYTGPIWEKLELNTFDL